MSRYLTESLNTPILGEYDVIVVGMGPGAIFFAYEMIKLNNNAYAMVDYAHNALALKSLLEAMRVYVKGRLICLFGCGGDRDKTKRPIMGSIAAKLSDYVIVTSDNPRSEEPEEIIKDITEGMKDTKTPYVVIPKREEAIKYAVQNAAEGDIIVLAGKGHETYQILKEGKIHFDEREIIAEALK